jgi:hypothetical protein
MDSVWNTILTNSAEAVPSGFELAIEEDILLS